MKTKKKKNKPVIKIIFAVIIILVLILIVLLLMQTSLFDYIKRIRSEPTLYPIKDECSLMLGNVLHPIKDEDNCRIRCDNICTTNKLDMDRIEFTGKNDSCNICNCYCK